MITLDIISDPICPWCYIGKTHLETATQRAGFDPFDVQWRPFQLNPDMPKEGMDRKAYLEAKFGKERAEGFYKQIEDTAIEAGLDVRFDLIERTPNTFDAHRLIRWSPHLPPIIVAKAEFKGLLKLTNARVNLPTFGT